MCGYHLQHLLGQPLRLQRDSSLSPGNHQRIFDFYHVLKQCPAVTSSRSLVTRLCATIPAFAHLITHLQVSMGLFTPSSDNESNTSKHRADRDGSKLVRSWSSFLQPTSLISTVILTGSFFLARHIHRRFLRQIPDVIDVEKSWYRRRSLLGYVTTIGDGDNFRMFHTPGGYFAGWGWLRKIPRLRKELAGRTVRWP